MESGPVVKTMNLLETLAGGQSPRVLADIAAASGISRPTVHRLLQLLSRLGYVESVGRGSYRLTDKLRQLAMGMDERQLVDRATPVLQSLRTTTEETVNLGVLRGDQVSYLLVLESAHALRRAAVAGETDPFYCTALGRAIVAHLPAARRSQLLGSVKLEARTSQTVVKRPELEAILEQVRTVGHAIEQDQTDLGVTCVAAPIMQGDRVIAAVSVSAASARLNEKKIKQLTRTIADCAKSLSSESPAGKPAPSPVGE